MAKIRKMPQRVTVMLDDELMLKLRNLQAKKMRKSAHSVSFSSLLNKLVEEGLKKK